jgi:hypothetical protein
MVKLSYVVVMVMQDQAHSLFIHVHFYFLSMGQAEHSQLTNTISVWQLVVVSLSARLPDRWQTQARLGRAQLVQERKQVALQHLGQACLGLGQFGWPGRPGVANTP